MMLIIDIATWCLVGLAILLIMGICVYLSDDREIDHGQF